MKTGTPFPLVKMEVVDWLDHCGSSGWADLAHHQSKTAGLMRCRSVGFVLHEDKEVLTLVQNQGGNATGDHTMSIAKRLIISRRRIR